MTTITVHEHTYRNGRPVAVPRTASMAPPVLTDPVQIAKQARSHLIGGRWRQHAKVGSPQDKADAYLSVHAPGALALPQAARHALTVDAGKLCCRWKAALFFASLAGEPEPPRTEVTFGLLGKPCSPCGQRHAHSARIAEVRSETPAERAAAGARYAPKPIGGTQQERERWWAGKLGIPLDQHPTDPVYYRRRSWPGEAARRHPTSQAAEFNRRVAQFYEQARQARRGRP